MKPRHQLNPHLKRLEPTYTACQFCQIGHSENMEKNHFAPVFKVADRTNIVVYSSVKFNKVFVGLSRCNQCHSIHNSSLMYGWLICIAIVVILVPSTYPGGGGTSLVYWIFFAIFFCSFSLVMGPPFVANLIVKNKNIKTKKEGALSEPQIQQMLREGWSLTQPSA